MRFALCLCATLALAACGGSNEGAAPAAETTAPEAAAPAASQPAPVQTAAYVPKPPADTGEGIFARQCAYCHAPGVDHPGTMQLGATRGEDFAVLVEREDLTADYVKYIVRNGLNGMPPFTPTTLTDAELDTVAAYLAKGE
jgi:mono/diheme cytochrome c family protein